jgi:hypothetical protein
MSIKASVPRIARLNVLIFFTPAATFVLGETRLTVRSVVQSKHCASHPATGDGANFGGEMRENVRSPCSRRKPDDRLPSVLLRDDADDCIVAKRSNRAPCHAGDLVKIKKGRPFARGGGLD